MKKSRELEDLQVHQRSRYKIVQRWHVAANGIAKNHLQTSLTFESLRVTNVSSSNSCKERLCNLWAWDCLEPTPSMMTGSAALALRALLHDRPCSASSPACLHIAAGSQQGPAEHLSDSFTLQAFSQVLATPAKIRFQLLFFL